MKKRDLRHKVLIRARLRGDCIDSDACIRDVSATGLLMQAPDAPLRGAYVEVLANGEALIGRVVWTSGRRFGVSLQDRLNVRRLIGGTGASVAASDPARPLRPRTAPAPTAAMAKSKADTFAFAIVLIFVLSLVAIAGSTAYETFSQPLNQALRHLRPN